MPKRFLELWVTEPGCEPVRVGNPLYLVDVIPPMVRRGVDPESIVVKVKWEDEDASEAGP